ncbi:MAG: hypothetical protein ACOYK8_07275 [Alphaproteobacteria bacterium]
MLSRADISEIIQETAIVKTINRLPPQELLSMCTTFSYELAEELKEKGIKLVLATSSTSKFHTYTQYMAQEELLIIDVTLRQFIPDYDAIFIGTRQELLKACTSFPLQHSSVKEYPFAAFMMIWGKKGEGIGYNDHALLQQWQLLEKQMGVKEIENPYAHPQYGPPITLRPLP